MIYSRITGTGSYLPEKVLTNAQLEKMVDTSNEWIVDRTGIHERRIAGPEETTTAMAISAAKNAIDAAGIKKQDIDLIVVATTTPDFLFPSVACLVQAELGVPECPAFDLVAACAGFNYALAIANNFIKTGQSRCALVIGSESMSRIVNWEDRNTCVLFGDGAGAVILQSGEEPGIISTHLQSAGKYKELLWTYSGINPERKATIYMSGSEVFKVAVTKLSEILEETLAANKVQPEELDWLVPHQANLRIIAAMAKKLRMPMDKVVLTLDKHGNTSAASVPLALDEAVRSGKIKRGQLILLESFGAGFAWGSALIRY